MIRNNEIPQRSWQVLLLEGPSGVGKTSVSYRLASHFGIGITEVDDFQVILERMTTPTEQPVLHYWRTHPEAGNLSAEEIVKQTIAVGQVMASALEAVITNHIESRTPLVLDGDFILPGGAISPAFSRSLPGGVLNQSLPLIERCHSTVSATIVEDCLRCFPCKRVFVSITTGWQEKASSLTEVPGAG